MYKGEGARHTREEDDMSERLSIKMGRRTILLRLEEIDCIEADRNYIRIHSNDRVFQVRQTLGGIEKRLQPDRFVRINRSVIVNVDRINELRASPAYSYQIVMDDDRGWSWGRKFRANLQRLLVP